MILKNYYNRDILNTFTSITLFVISLVSANTIIRFFNDAYTKGLSFSSVIYSTILFIPTNLVLVIPVALFLAIIICFGKYFSNNEMFVTLSCGTKWSTIVGRVMKLVLLLTVLQFFTVMYLLPFSHRTTDVLRQSLSTKAIANAISAKKFIKPEGNITAYINKKSGQNLDTLFSYKGSTRTQGYEILTAPSGKIVEDEGKTVLNIQKPNIYIVNPISSKSSYIVADKATRVLSGNIAYAQSGAASRAYLGSLIKRSFHGDKLAKGELAFRIGFIIDVIIAALIALSMCRLNPRQNKYAKLLPATVVLGIFLSISMFISSMVSKGQIPITVIPWLPPLIFGILATRKLSKQNGENIIFKKKGAK